MAGGCSGAWGPARSAGRMASLLPAGELLVVFAAACGRMQPSRWAAWVAVAAFGLGAEGGLVDDGPGTGASGKEPLRRGTTPSQVDTVDCIGTGTDVECFVDGPGEEPLLSRVSEDEEEEDSGSLEALAVGEVGRDRGGGHAASRAWARHRRREREGEKATREEAAATRETAVEP
ncbi:hypothetical protein E2562_013169 [Oryza meyeriana var. granulata]|uniref:DUF834 domain-containing protein n=1 Tax=Oryza meyeriana var. granulata TaxID=110450 RepID=A0A6G1DJ13_9ORYZ|nr:hypothetical protein E2562_013169 [Oryza meyeriana var. granulata]